MLVFVQNDASAAPAVCHVLFHLNVRNEFKLLVWDVRGDFYANKTIVGE